MTPTPKPEHGLGLGVAITSVIILAAILATIVYLKLTRADVTEKPAATTQSTLPARSGREGDARILRRRRAVLAWTSRQPHTSPTSASESGPTVIAALAPGPAPRRKRSPRFTEAGFERSAHAFAVSSSARLSSR
jgi:hypothetical protein